MCSLDLAFQCSQLQTITQTTVLRNFNTNKQKQIAIQKDYSVQTHGSVPGQVGYILQLYKITLAKLHICIITSYMYIRPWALGRSRKTSSFSSTTCTDFLIARPLKAQYNFTHYFHLSTVAEAFEKMYFAIHSRDLLSIGALIVHGSVFEHTNHNNICHWLTKDCMWFFFSQLCFVIILSSSLHQLPGWERGYFLLWPNLQIPNTPM